MQKSVCKETLYCLRYQSKTVFDRRFLFDLQSLRTVLKISRARLLRFSNRFLHWNRVIKTVVLTTIKATNRSIKNLQNLAVYLKNGLKNLICGKIWPDWAKWVFIWVCGDPKYEESFEISQAPKSLFLSVICILQDQKRLDAMPATTNQIEKKIWNDMWKVYTELAWSARFVTTKQKALRN